MSDTMNQALGGSATKAGLHAVLKTADSTAGKPKYFASPVSDVAGEPDYASFLHADGAGTKPVFAYLEYRETGDTSAFADLPMDAIAMNLDDVFAVGPVESLTISNIVSRNYKIIDDRCLAAIVEGYERSVALLKKAGISIVLAGGETADSGDCVRNLLVDAVLFGRIKRESLIDCRRISAGDVVVGLESFGQADYELRPNSGLGCNGLTLARHSLLSKYYREKYPEVVAPELSPDATFRGPYKLSDQPEALGMSIGSALRSPTKTYAPILSAIYSEHLDDIHGVIHNSGGGQTKVLRFIDELRVVKDNLFSMPALFSLIEKHGQVSRKEMYQVFNMGHRLELYLSESKAEKIIAISKSFGVSAKIVGHVESASGKSEVLIEDADGKYSYGLEARQ